ncbi:MAG: cell division protein FtsA [Rickettsiales bacterium]
MLFEKKNNFCFVDVGSYKTVCLICRINGTRAHYLSSGIVKTRGIKRGKINDAGELKASILAAVFEAEQAASVNVDEVVISISSTECFEKKAIVRDYLFGKQVSKGDIKKLVNKSLSELDSSKHEVIHNFSNRFCLDDITVVKNPENLFADSIEAEVYMVYSNISHLVNVATILAGCHLKPLEFVLDVYASSLAVLPDGANKSLVIDIGGDSTKYGFFDDGALSNSGTILIGGSNITKDIAAFFSTSFEEAERLKTVYGDLLSLSDNKLVPIKQALNPKEGASNSIKGYDLNQVILARLEELAEIVQKKVSHLKFSTIYLTGGGAKIPGTAKLFENVVKKRVEVCDSKFSVGNSKVEKDPTYFTAIGLVKCFLFDRAASGVSLATNPLLKILNWLKANF